MPEGRLILNILRGGWFENRLLSTLLTLIHILNSIIILYFPKYFNSAYMKVYDFFWLYRLDEEGKSASSCLNWHYLSFSVCVCVCLSEDPVGPFCINKAKKRRGDETRESEEKREDWRMRDDKNAARWDIKMRYWWREWGRREKEEREIEREEITSGQCECVLSNNHTHTNFGNMVLILSSLQWNKNNPQMCCKASVSLYCHWCNHQFPDHPPLLFHWLTRDISIRFVFSDFSFNCRTN